MPEFAQFQPGTTPAVARLPPELLFPLLAQLPLTSIFALSATCRSLRNLITHPPFLDQVLKEAIMQGSLQWVRPVATIPRGENNRARKALLLWLSISSERGGPLSPDGIGDGVEGIAPGTSLSELDRHADGEEMPIFDELDDDDDDDEEDKEDAGGEDPLAILISPNCPRLAFVRACWRSNSMMNRKRLWGQVGRFAVLWKDYRMNGWQNPKIFLPQQIV